jgi:hypothetical protein
MPSDSDQIMTLLGEAKQLAQAYRGLTSKPLGITGEVAEYEAARLLNLTLAPARQAGYDALEERGGSQWRLQIKGRCLLKGHKPGQRIGSIRATHEWDAVLLVLLDDDLEATAMYEADRKTVLDALEVPGSKARNERGSLSVEKFRKLPGVIQRWPVKGGQSQQNGDV